jgi:hypothetical protein
MREHPDLAAEKLRPPPPRRSQSGGQLGRPR